MHSKLVFLFPGHGCQSVRMINDLYKKFSIVRNTIKYSSMILNLDIFKIIEDKRKIKSSLYLQLIITIANVSIWRLWNQKNGQTPNLFLGHSLGEYTAFVCNNNITFKESLFLIKKRSELMHFFFKKKKMEMLVLLDIKINLIKNILFIINKKYNVYTSIINSKKQVVLSIFKRDLKFIKAIFKKNNIFFFLLDLKIASHCNVLFFILKDFNFFLKNLKYVSGRCRILHNLNINYCSNKKNLNGILLGHLQKTINWVESLKYMEYIGFKNFVECGSNQILKNLFERTTNLFCKRINNYCDFKKNLRKQ